MKEISLNILDIAENSAKAEATKISIRLEQTDTQLVMSIADNGYGMKPETVQCIVNPFYTTRTTRPVGMGLPLLQMAAVQTGGIMKVTSKHKEANPEDHGTIVTAVFRTDHIDCPPLGDVVSTVTTLIQGHPDIDFLFNHQLPTGAVVELDTLQLREILEGVPLDSYEVLQWIHGYLQEAYEAALPAGQ